MAVLFGLLLAVLFSHIFIIAPDRRCSSRGLGTRAASLHSSHHWLVGCGSASDSL